MDNGFDHRTAATLKRASARLKALQDENAALKCRGPVAVIGMACRFPGGADDPARLWDLLAAARDAVVPVPATRWDLARWWHPDPEAPGRAYVRDGGFLGDVAGFDPGFFNITPREALALDPQQRLLLEVSWEAFEDAGCNPKNYAGTRAGVFVGLANYDYIQAHVHSGDPARIDAYSGSGVMFSTAAGRLSYVYDFQGPCLTVDTACSSSLVALDLALKSLRRGDCDLALAGGASLMLSPDAMVALCKVKALAPDGRSRAFDDAAAGYGRGEGCGLVLLKRLDDALRDGDRIQAVLAGAAVNHDGRSNGLTAPSGPAQQAVIRAALDDAGLDPAAIGYVEAHGTGTRLGDPIEVNALARVFAPRPAGAELLIGSVKSNIGHAEAAAGIAGVIKAVLALRHGVLPPSLHVATPNRLVDWAALPVRLVTAAQPWPAGPRAAGVSAFGLSGTNAHLVVTEAPPAAAVPVPPIPLLVLSAATPDALVALAGRWRCRLAAAAPDELAALLWTAARRAPLDLRRVAFGDSPAALVAALDSGAGEPPPGAAPTVVAAAARWLQGDDIDWPALLAAPGRRTTAAPLYPFQRQPLWLPVGPLRPGQGADGPNFSPDEAATMDGGADNLAITADLTARLAAISGFDPGQIEPRRPLTDMGLDSLMMLKFAQEIERGYGVALRLGQFFDELATVDAIAQHLRRHGRPPAPTPVAPAAPALPGAPVLPAAPALPVAGAAGTLFQQQMQLVAQVAAQNLAGVTELVRLQLAQGAVPAALVPAAPAPAAPRPAPPRSATAPAANFRGLNLAAVTLDARQQAFVTALVADHVARTGRSKAQAEASRAVLADWKSTLSFWGQLKEAKYPIVGARFDGARMWDLDGNGYVDIAMGMGVHGLGHRPAGIHAALQDELAAGLGLGTQTALAGDVAQLVHELTGCARVTFCNTGSEAVMVALRLARAVTGRSRVALFKHAFHGTFDGVLAVDVEGEAVPIGPGTLPAMIDDLLLLDYGSDAALAAIEAAGHTLAAVLVEPVQSRHPDLQPQRFLADLRRLTAASGTALIFDEMITGFRIHPGGAQAWFGVTADLALYGKVAGGGLPIGVVAGSARFLDAIDGGPWAYGDSSRPQVPMIYFGGTFCRNPATMATARAALATMKAAGPDLQATVNARTGRFCDRLNLWFESRGVPLRAEHFAAQWRLVPLGDRDSQPIELELLHLLMMKRGVYTWERRICFFSTAHGDGDVDQVFGAITDGIAELRQGGFAWSVERHPRPSFAPLTSVQRRLYAVAQWPAGELAYHMPQAFRIAGPLDADRLEQALRRVIARHPSLRTGFVEIDGAQWAKTWDEPRFMVERCTATEADVEGIIAGFVRPFDLAQAPLFRALVASLGPDRHLLLTDVHHMVADGLSANIIGTELMALYDGATLAPITYDLARCQDRAGAGGEGARGEANGAFWAATLAGDLPRLALPEDRPRGPLPAFRGDTVTLVIPPATTRALKALGRQAGTSLYGVMLAAWSVLLHRLTGQEEVVIGGAVAGRDQAELAEAVGMFVNTVAFRIRPAAATPFRDHLAAVAAQSRAVYDHQDYPFEAIAALDRDRPANRHPVFDTILSYDNAGERAFRTRDLAFVQQDIATPGAMVDLLAEVIDTDERLTLRLTYATALFDRATIARWAAGFECLLAAILATPDQALGRLPVVGPDEAALLERFNATAAAYPEQATLLDLFAAQAARQPDRPAVRCGDHALSYRELDRDSTALAARLAARVAPGALVGLFLDRSAAAVVAMLASLKAGAAYVPLDPLYPTDLIDHMIGDAGCGAVLTSAELAATLPAGRRHLALTVDGDAPPAALPPAPVPADTAYVIYTSGSTGRPKGCLISHRNVVRLLVNDRCDFAFGPDDVWLCAHSFSFDFSVWEIWGALAYGGQVVIAARDDLRDPARLLALVRLHRVSVLNQTPGAFYGLIAAEEAASRDDLADHLHTVIFGGDRLEPSYLRPWAARYGLDRPVLVNMYGITETTVHVSYHRLTDADVFGSPGLSLIGRPLPDTTIEVLSPLGERQPLGVAGELYVGGGGVSAGYLNRPELTAARFVGHHGRRLYRTGDLGRLRPDGRLDYLGRNDHQVQIRGHRVELGAIEQALLDHPGITRAVATIHAAAAGGDHLVAYLVGAAGLTADTLRGHLERYLPDYMIPHHFVALEGLPLTANGKLDRDALPPPETARLAPGTAFAAPESAAARTIAGVWAAVLGLPRVGLDDNFFALGGDSIKALQIVSRLRKAGIHLTLGQIFAARTVGALAGQVAPVAAPRPAGAGAGRAGLTAIQHWLIGDLGRDPGHFNNVALLASVERIDPAALQQALDRVVAHHDVLRISLDLTAQPPQQVIAPTLAVPVEQVDLPHDAALTAHATALHRTIDVTRPPLLRVVVYHLPEGDRLMVLVHHLMIDGLSWRILMEDLTAAYQAARDGAPITLPPTGRPWLDWVGLVQGYAASAELHAELPYWRAVDATPVPPLPQDFDDPANEMAAARWARLELDTARTAALLTAVPRAHGVQINAILLTVVARAFRACFGVERLRVRLEGHGREEIAPDVDLSRTMGWFTSMFPVVLDLAGTTDVADELRVVAETLERIPRKGLGYGLLKYLSPERPDGLTGFGRQPEVGFNYLGQFEDEEGGGFRFADTPTGPLMGPGLPRQIVLEVEPSVVNGRLVILVGYNSRMHGQATIDRLMAGFEDALAPLTGAAPDLPAPDLPAPDLPAPVLARLGVAPTAIEAVLPLSPLQEGLYFHALSGDRLSYFQQFTYRLTGPLDLDRYRAAWQAVAARHQALRAAMVEGRDGRPVQVVLKRRDLPFVVEDARGLAAADQAARLAALTAADQARGFDLAADPLMRVTVLRTGAEVCEVLWTDHHIAVDGWSLTIIQGEVMAIYEDLDAGRPVTLAPAPQFARHLDWLARRDDAAGRRYWRALLADPPPPSTVPGLDPAGRAAGRDLGAHVFRLDRAETARLGALTARLNVTLNTLVQALWAVLLAGFNGRDDVIFGAVVSGRPPELDGVEAMVGLFLQTVPVRLRLDRAASFATLCAAVQNQAAASEPFHHVPLAEMQRLDGVRRTLFDHVLVFENYPLGGGDGGRFRVDQVRIAQRMHYDFDLMIDPGEELVATFTFNREVIAAAEFSRIEAQFRRLVGAVLATPDAPLDSLDLGAAAPLAAGQAPPPGRVLDLVAAQVAARPQAIAVEAGGASLCYEALDARAGRLARVLAGQGVAPGDTVALALPPGADYIASCLGVLKAGGVFAALDLEQPPRRCATVLGRLRPRAVVTDAAGSALLAALPDAAPEGVVVWGPQGALEAAEAPCPEGVPGLDAPAYAVFTSGSTGEPKAILGSHQALHHFIAWEVAELEAGPGLRVANLAPPSFDVSLRDIFLPLAAGGTVCVPDPALRGDGAGLAAWLAAARVAVVHAVPSLFRQVLAALEGAGEGLPDLRHLLFAGELLRGGDVARARAALGGAVTIRNLYGPSETTLAKFSLTLGAALPDAARAVPVGRPLPGVGVVVVKDGRPAPDGAIGEVWIAPPFRPLGYLDDPARTAESFVAAPPALGGAGLYYRSGDLGRLLADGVLEICGRLDGQVKINGIRVELAEVEAAVLTCAGIDQAAVLALPRADGDLALACYYTDRQPVPVEALREHLALDLPRGLIPAFFLRLDAFPLSLNGKIDRRALPRPEELVADRIPYVAPVGPTESRIAAIWAEVLGLPRVGAGTPFFAIGGDSLRAIRVLARINQAFDAHLTIAGFFAGPTVRALAAILDGKAGGAGAVIPAMPPAADYPLSHAQRRLWVLDQMGGHPAAYSLPASYRIDGPLDGDAVAAAFAALVARHEVLRTVFVTVDGEPRQKILAAPEFRVERQDLSAAPDPERQARALARCHGERRFDLARGPLLAVSLLHLGPEAHVLLVNIHHIVADAWSVSVMIDELARLMAGAELPPLRLHYRDYASWEREYLATPAAAATRAWWHRQLTPPPERLALPGDRPAPSLPSLCGARLGRALDPATIAALRAQAGAAGSSLFSGLLAVLSALLARYSGQDDLVVGTPVAARDEAELDGQVGFYVNTLPLRLTVAPADGLAVAMAKVGEVLIGALDHRRYPFDRLVEDLEPARDASRPPLFDVMAVYQEAGQRRFALDGARVSPFAAGPGIAKFPLTVEFIEGDDGLRLELEYATDLFDAPRMARFADHLQALLAAAVAAPATALGDLEIMTAAERERLLGVGPAQPLPDTTIDGLFAEWVAADPDHPAVICEAVCLSYGTLAARAARLAAALYAAGLAPGAVVGVLVPRSEYLPVAFLGVVRAGGVYLPLDPAAPAERLRLMAAEAGMGCLVLAGADPGLLPGLETIDLTTLGDGPAAASADRAAAPDSLAYVIYTSGSGGRPKGVLLDHRGAVNLALAQRHGLAIAPRHRVLQFAPAAFDASIWEMVMALLNGATLVVAPPERIADPARLAAYLAEHQVSVATLPPAYLAELPDAALDPLELLITAGEAPEAERARRLARRLTYVNAYGPTETTVCASWHQVAPEADGPVPIGRAIANASLVVLDGRGRLCPVGVPGEIHIGGAGLARGYLGAPALTEAAFMPHPFIPGDRLYRSGDRGVVNADGTIGYLGRSDGQVKLRGHRVELGEIERVLARQPGVAQAAVVLHRNGGAAALVAYVAPADAVAADALRRALAWTLPEYMIPAHWMLLEALPLTASGKIDHAALPPVAPVTGEIAAETPLEAALAPIWRDILRCGGFSRDDRFYELGGDSIKAIQLVGRLRQAGYQIEMREFLAAPTLAAVAARLAAQAGWTEMEDAADSPVALDPAEYQGLFGGE